MWHEGQWEGTLLYSCLQAPLCVLKLPAKAPGTSAHFTLPRCILDPCNVLQKSATSSRLVSYAALSVWLPLTAG